MTVPSDARETILARVREALRLPAPPPHLAAHDKPAVAAGSPLLPVVPAAAARPWLPDGGSTAAERLRILLDNLDKLRARVFTVPDAAAAAACVAGIARERDWKRVAWHGDPLVEAALAGLHCATHRVDGRPPLAADDLEACDAGITSCEALVAQTGSILVSSGAGGRALSILPHVHVVVATPDRIVATLGDALALIRERHAGRLPSMLSFITGPSRTGDIERILVLGAHGPKELVLVLVGPG